MTLLSTVLVAIVAALHLWFLVLEMFLWRKPIGLKTFGKSSAFAAESAVLAANQGLYNGFLVAGLVWSLLASDPAQALSLKLFFLGCVSVAGIYGGVTVTKRIFFVQALPALLALGLLLLTGSPQSP
jgi:putative membrane protein